MKYKYSLILLFLCKSIGSSCQAVPAGTEVQELVKIAEVYANLPYMSFDLRYTFADSLTWYDYTDSLEASCQISYGRSFMSNSSIEMLRGKEYNVFVDKIDSVIIAMRRNDFQTIFQMPLLDSTFREGHVESMNVTELNDSTWRFVVTFKPDSYYSLYEMRYNPNTGLIWWVNYHGKNEAGDHDIPADHIICAFIYMTNYSDAELDPTLFNENRYFYILNGTMYLQPAWQQFQLQN